MPAGARSSLRPLHSRGRSDEAKLGRNAPRGCERVSPRRKRIRNAATSIISDRHPEAAASSAALEGRQPGCTSPAAHPSRLRMRCIRIARLAPPATTASPLREDDGTETVSAERFGWIEFGLHIQIMVMPLTRRSVASTVRCRAGAHASASRAACWVPALRSSVRTLQRVRDTTPTRPLLNSCIDDGPCNKTVMQRN